MRRIVTRAVIPFLGLALAACATSPLPPAKQLQTRDLARLGGTWVWTESSVSANRFGVGPIKIRVADGRMEFDSSSSSGILRLHEDVHKRVLKGEGHDKFGGRRFLVELTQRAGRPGTSDSTAIAGTPGTSFVVVTEE